MRIMILILNNIYFVIKGLAFVPNVINQIHLKIGAKNVIPKNFNKILVIGLVEMSI
ncbi:hypothetical protein C1645_776478 [Glomus cerebriforme]|uniref:Uncharacterized protein n=1 Tax=Glomus cerebriforme TaxID=658196 RepID=A0A397SS88_9GLOM|nr:hypothetical protein C1645_776478 [Glomus cerebriforme]